MEGGGTEPSGTPAGPAAADALVPGSRSTWTSSDYKFNPYDLKVEPTEQGAARLAESGPSTAGGGSTGDARHSSPPASVGGTGEEGGAIKRKPGRQKRTSVLCQVLGCGEELINAKTYYRRYRICQHHSTLPSMVLDGRRQRFCQQCGRFHVLSEFQGTRKSCQRKLSRHNQRRRQRFDDAEGDGFPASGMQAAGWEEGEEDVAAPEAEGGVSSEGVSSDKQERQRRRRRRGEPDPAPQGAAPAPTRQQQARGSRSSGGTGHHGSTNMGEEPSPVRARSEQQGQAPQPTGAGSAPVLPPGFDALLLDPGALDAALQHLPPPSALGGALQGQQQLMWLAGPAAAALRPDGWVPRGAAAPPCAPPPPQYAAPAPAPAPLQVGVPPPGAAGPSALPFLATTASGGGPAPVEWGGGPAHGWAHRAQAMAMASQPPFTSYSHRDQMERLSLKVFGTTPDLLLPAVRAELDQLISTSASLIEGHIRPGCTHLTLAALLPDGEAAPSPALLRPRLEALLASDSPLGTLLGTRGAVVQAGDRIVVVSQGKVCLEAAAGEALPVLEAVGPPALWAGAPPAGGGARALELRGWRVADPSALVLCRQRGRHLAVEVLGSSWDTEPARGEQEWVCVWPLGLVPGCAELEVQVGNLLSAPRPLLVLPDRAAVAEVGLVIRFTHRHMAAAAAAAEGCPALPFSLRLRQRVAATAQRLVAVAASRGCPALAALLLEGACADGCSAEAAVAAMDAACPAGSTLLHVAAGTGCTALPAVLQRWAQCHSAGWHLRSGGMVAEEVEGAPLLTPVHVAEVLPDGGAMRDALAALDPEEARRLWEEPLPGGVPAARQLAAAAAARGCPSMLPPTSEPGTPDGTTPPTAFHSGDTRLTDACAGGTARATGASAAGADARAPKHHAAGCPPKRASASKGCEDSAAGGTGGASPRCTCCAAPAGAGKRGAAADRQASGELAKWLLAAEEEEEVEGGSGDEVLEGGLRQAVKAEVVTQMLQRHIKGPRCCWATGRRCCLALGWVAGWRAREGPALA
eukprot:scaffold2.g7040.t1